MVDERKLGAGTARQLAVQANVDPTTIQKVYRGQSVRGHAGERARRALEAAGLLTPGERGIAAQRAEQPEAPPAPPAPPTGGRW